MSGPSTRLLTGYADLVVRHPWRVIVVSLLSVIALSFGMKNLTFSTDFRVFFGPGNPQLKAFDELQDVYGHSDSSFIVVEAKSGNIFEPQTLEAIRELTAEAWKLPYSVRVDSLTNYPYTEAAGDDLKVEMLLAEGREITPERIAKIREVALHDPMQIGRASG